MSRHMRCMILVVAVLCGAHANAWAIISFDFNALKDGDNNSKVQTYMNGVLASARPGSSVTVSGALAERDYDGDDHVTGPVSGHSVSSETLGTSDGGVHHSPSDDNFLVNKDGSDRITMLFSFPVYSLSFDYEIFPDGTCQKQGSSCQPTGSNWPDFSLKADNVLQFRSLGIVPGQSGAYAHSPDSGWNHNEKAPQLLATSGIWNFSTGVTKLEFVDWPRRIGIDNLSIDETPKIPHTPEPASVFLMGGGLLGLAGWRRRDTIKRD